MIKHPLFVIIACAISIAAGFKLGSSYIEIFASVMGVINVWLLARQKVLNFLFGAIAVACFMYIYFNTGLYAMVVLAALQIIFNIYGWYYWVKNKGEEDVVPTIRLSSKGYMIWISIILVSWGIWSYIQVKFTDASNPYLDAFIAVIGLAAQYLLSKKILENWHLWILMNVISIVVYFSTGLYVMILLAVINLFLCIDGLIEWKQAHQANRNREGATGTGF
ncbi:nicotinamide riboside transporter PnuC [Paenibacillus sp. SC116]|uniref:nicotinamide riboside transporter PnuC n=1 Tax=Paenibacillus sp. SC116 TaxID=2968986 RepID=UPI00215B4A97|nr:nicotinamide riboside transporter PnuC [Paenibacillus sp. SC116]MCR8843597.1 nicotinamide riboside transporter PnuC [Paenibacillus sp. SC116]